MKNRTNLTAIGQTATLITYFPNYLNRHLYSAMRGITIGLLLFFSSCYSTQWNKLGDDEKINSGANAALKTLFAHQPQSAYQFPLLSPGLAYQYDISEKDRLYDNPEGKLQFERITFQLAEKMRDDQLLVNVYLWDKYQNYLSIKKVDLLRIVPALDTKGDMQYAEYLLEEFSRFGIKFRREHKEFNVVVKTDDPALKQHAESIYRVDLTNNCLDPTKWEIQVVSEDYAGYGNRQKGKFNYNQNRMVSHGWFYLDKDIYSELLAMKNPTVADDQLFSYSYDSLSNIAENTVIDFEQLRQPLQYKIMSMTTAVGHKKNMPLRPIDLETGYKWSMGLLGADTFLTYRSVLEKPMRLAKFHQEGFYDVDDPKVFDFGFLKHIDKAKLHSIDVKGSDCYVEVELTGKHAPYKFIIGNVDFALLEEQKLYGINTGVNVYPKSQRYNPKQNTIAYAPDLTPKDRKPYFLMVDAKTGKWVNNQYKGVEKIYLSYSGLNKNTLEIYLLSYERELPVWYGKVRLGSGFQELVRARKNLFAN